jgi:hypothetical protein
VLVREGDRAAAALLEGDPSLRVESDPRRRRADAVLSTVEAANPGGWELAGEEEDRVAVAAPQHQDPLGWPIKAEDGGGERGQGWSGHAARS